MIEVIDASAEAAKGRYGAFASSLVGELAISPAGAIPPQVMDARLASVALRYGDSELPHAAAAIYAVSAHVLGQAPYRRGLADAVNEHADASAAVLHAAISAQALLDAGKAGMEARRDMIARHGVLGAVARIGGFVDRSGRRWDSSRYVAVSYRAAMVSFCLDATLMCASALGEKRIGTTSGEVLGVDSAREYKGFHPNAGILPVLLLG